MLAYKENHLLTDAGRRPREWSNAFLS